jgi:hypothetical protein
VSPHRQCVSMTRPCSEKTRPSADMLCQMFTSVGLQCEDYTVPAPEPMSVQTHNNKLEVRLVHGGHGHCAARSIRWARGRLSMAAWLKKRGLRDNALSSPVSGPWPSSRVGLWRHMWPDLSGHATCSVAELKRVIPQTTLGVCRDRDTCI